MQHGGDAEFFDQVRQVMSESDFPGGLRNTRPAPSPRLRASVRIATARAESGTLEQCQRPPEKMVADRDRDLEIDVLFLRRE